LRYYLWSIFLKLNLIIKKTQLSPNVTRLEVIAKRISQIREPGQFVIVRAKENWERIPLTVCDANPVRVTTHL
jgi:NAD(P)H-flavin reductase